MEYSRCQSQIYEILETLKISSQIGDGHGHAPASELSAEAFVEGRDAQRASSLVFGTQVELTLVRKLSLVECCSEVIRRQYPSRNCMLLIFKFEMKIETFQFLETENPTASSLSSQMRPAAKAARSFSVRRVSGRWSNSSLDHLIM